MKKGFFILIIILFLFFPLGAQSSGGTWAKPDDEAEPVETEEDPSPAEEKEVSLPEGYRQIKLGMSLEEVKDALKDDIYFDYKGDPDVSFRPYSSEPVIAVDGNSFIDKGYFQFYDKKLYIIILLIDPQKIDHYSIYSSLKESYGDPDSLSPREIIWEFQTLRLALERPLSVKYIDLVTFNRLKKSGQAKEDWLESSKGEFLDQF